MPAPIGNRNAAKDPMDARSADLHIRVLPMQYEHWKLMAAACDMTLTAWAEIVLNWASNKLGGYQRLKAYLESAGADRAADLRLALEKKPTYEKGRKPLSGRNRPMKNQEISKAEKTD